MQKELKSDVAITNPNAESHHISNRLQKAQRVIEQMHNKTGGRGGMDINLAALAMADAVVPEDLPTPRSSAAKASAAAKLEEWRERRKSSRGSSKVRQNPSPKTSAPQALESKM
ncbi:hypothetical protein CYMTET_39536 [Cymbomonas tetramitiformis]|uniref:Uncharacterized protein n=1 Tax=Cymbomonas tetramitiformis TaxID=36881 RepID=A0AAE0CC35_9CHLO|nr:hypothetical protein CYMTET_39536 [Cymbomonas tetramitiformis]